MKKKVNCSSLRSVILPKPVDPMLPREVAGNNRGSKRTSGVDCGIGVTRGKQVARKESKAVGKSSHEGRAVLLVYHHVVDKAESSCQEELEEEAACDALAVHLRFQWTEERDRWSVN